MALEAIAPTASGSGSTAPSTHAAPRPWTHNPSLSRNFLPPTISLNTLASSSNSSPAPAPLSLLNDTLDLAREYRDLVETLGRLELEYGRSMAAAIKKFETRLDSLTTPLPGQRKAGASTLHTSLRVHMEHLRTVASLHQKHPGALGGQLVEPLTHVERRGAETTRRLAGWAKDLRSRNEESKEKVEKAKGKYHASVANHQVAVGKVQAAKSGQPGVEVDMAKLEKNVKEAERAREEKKRAYVLVLAGEGAEGGQGRDSTEGGAWTGSFYGHLHTSLVELFRHHADEDSSHLSLLSSILERARDAYSTTSCSTDTDAFLDFYTAAVLDDDDGSSSAGHGSQDLTSSPGIVASVRRHSTSMRRGSSGVSSSARPSSFVPPPSAKMETIKLVLDKQEHKYWLVNTWMNSRTKMEDLLGKDGGLMATKHGQLTSLKTMCETYLADRGLGDPDETWERRAGLFRELGPDERKLAIAKAEMAFIESYLGPHPAPETRHELHERPFPTPSTCGVCTQSIWSPFANEFACALCNLAVHSRCALYADPECSGLKSRRRPPRSSGGLGGGGIRRGLRTGSKLLRRSSTLLMEAPHGAPREGMPPLALVREIDRRHDEPLRDDELHVSPFIPSSELDRPALEHALTEADQSGEGRGEGMVLARVAHVYIAAGEFEMSVKKGEVVRVIEPDLDGLGWVKVRRGLENGEEGLVPQSYIGFVGTSTPPLDGGSGRFVQAMYDFPPPEHTLSRGEVAVAQHALYELSDAGMTFAQNWCELVVPDGSGARLRGFVPKSYVAVV